ncbi:MAG: hypothetical protein R2941_11115 [Desulfobacterales bacterium]
MVYNIWQDIIQAGSTEIWITVTITVDTAVLMIFWVFDAASRNFMKNLTGSIGVDNITDESYHISHPYPQRNYFAELKYSF